MVLVLASHPSATDEEALGWVLNLVRCSFCALVLGAFVVALLSTLLAITRLCNRRSVSRGGLDRSIRLARFRLSARLRRSLQKTARRGFIARAHNAPCLQRYSYALDTTFLDEQGRAVKLGDLLTRQLPVRLICADGHPKTITAIHRHRARVHRLQVSFAGKHPSRAYPDPTTKHWSDLRVTRDQVMLVQRKPTTIVHSEMVEVHKLKRRIERNFGKLPRVGRPQPRGSLRADNFKEALLFALGDWFDSLDSRTSRSRSSALRRITGVARVRAATGCYYAQSPRSLQEPPRVYPFHGPLHAHEGRVAALKAAIACSRASTERLDRSIWSLDERLRNRLMQQLDRFQVAVDTSLPGVAVCYDRFHSQPWSVQVCHKVGPAEYRTAIYRFHNGSNKADLVDTLGIRQELAAQRQSPFFTPLDELHDMTEVQNVMSKTVGELMDLTSEERRKWCLYKPLSFEYEEKAVPVPPLFLGLWLADGIREGPIIANLDEEEVINYLHHVAGIYDLSVKSYGHCAYSLTTGNRSQRPLPPVRTAAARGELEPRLTRKEQRELLASGYVRLRKGDEGYTRGNAASNFIRPGSDSPLSSPPLSPLPSLPPTPPLSPRHSPVLEPQPMDIDLPEDRVELDIPTVQEQPEQEVGAVLQAEREALAEAEAAAAAEDEEEEDDDDDDFVANARTPAHVPDPLGPTRLVRLQRFRERAPSPEADMEALDALIFGDEVNQPVAPPVIPDELERDGDAVMNRDPTSDEEINAPPDELAAQGDEEDMDVDADPGPPNDREAAAAARQAHELRVPEATRRHPNRLINGLRELRVLHERRHGRGPGNDTKRIPECYMFNTKAVRRQLLAGFIDGDGHYDYATNSFVIGQSTNWHMGLIEDLCFVIRSLGYPLSISYLDGQGHATADGRPSTDHLASCVLAFRPHKGEFPCLLERKIARGRQRGILRHFPIVGIAPDGEGEQAVASLTVEGNANVLRKDFIVLAP